MTPESATGTIEETRITWGGVWKTLTRPYPVTGPMILLVALVPFYLVIARQARVSAVHAPAVTLDRLLPLMPTWALVYGALYAFLIVLPVLVVQQREMIRRTVWTYVTVWSVAYICFLLYPTVAPRPDAVTGDGFAVWGLQFLYDSDPPYNCFPSIHVAHSFVSALVCYRVHRTLGVVALSFAALVAISTLFTKQHYVADVVAGMALAVVANAFWLRRYDRSNIPEAERRVAPVLAWCVGGLIGFGVAGFWAIYQLRSVSE